MKISKILIPVSLSITFLLFQNFAPNTKIRYDNIGSYLAIEDFQAKGDGITDDTIPIQDAVKYAFENKIKRIIFKPKTYVLRSRSSLNTIVLYGENLQIVGNGATFLKSSPLAGMFGDAISIRGLVKGTTYPRHSNAYNGELKQAKNIVISDLAIKHTTVVKGVNCIGISHAKDITLKNVTCENAPQSSFVVISYYYNQNKVDTTFKSEGIILDNTSSINSYDHAYRIQSYEGSPKSPQQHSLDVVIRNCSSSGVRGATTARDYSDIFGRKVNLWFRPGYGVAKLAVSNCKFDHSGEVLT